MSTKWSSTAFSKNNANSFGDLLKGEYIIAFLQGKNSFGDIIYCYLKVDFPNIEKLKGALQSEGIFNASDYGTIVAAGRGDPPEEVKAELAVTYSMYEKAAPLRPPSIVQPPIPAEKKAWDEY